MAPRPYNYERTRTASSPNVDWGGSTLSVTYPVRIVLTFPPEHKAEVEKFFDQDLSRKRRMEAARSLCEKFAADMNRKHGGGFKTFVDDR